MNELAGALAEATYNPSFNVYLVWLAGTLSIVYYGHYFLTTKYEDIIQNNDGRAPIYFWNGKFNFGLWLAIYPAFTYLLFGLLNDVIVIFIIGGTYLDIYNMMWFSQFLDASTIFDFLSELSSA
tara:strand:- start:46 stop:417 length:372 start_codon:yes stop_codon:yes gene_type:complete